MSSESDGEAAFGAEVVVEDSITVISAVESFLRKKDHKTYLARDGLTALASVRAFRPQLMLLDLMLPQIGGLDVCTMIRRNRAYDAMPIVVVTGLTDETSMAHAFEAGANDYITKPIDYSNLMACIEKCLSEAVASAELTPVSKAEWGSPHVWARNILA